MQRLSFVADISFMEKAKKTLLTIIVLIATQWAVPAQAQQAYLSDIVITNVEDHLLVYFTVKECFTPEMNSAIESGIETSFTFFVKLYEKIDLSIDNKVTDSSTVPNTAIIAISFMDTDSASAMRTGPPYIFIFYKCSNSMLFYVIKVFNHAHAVFRPISFIYMLYSVTGVFFTLKAIL